MNESNQPLKPLGHIPADIKLAQDYESLARHFLSSPCYEYIAGGAGRDQTLSANLAAFSARMIRPRILCDVAHGNTNLTLFNKNVAHPIFLAPVAYQKLAHPSGELETARAAEVMQSCMVCSTLSTYSLEDIANAGTGEKWFQLYFQSKPELTSDLIKRAESAGYTAIVVTVDASIRTPSLGALRAGFQMPDDCIAVNLARYEQSQTHTLPTGQSRIFQLAMRDAPTWIHLEQLMKQTHLPIIIKGVLHPADALTIKNMGCAGIIVSNHGGRSLDGAPASIDCLTQVRSAVGDNYPILFDSGIRSGLDIFKAIAAGADAVLIGRLQLYALSVAGALGVAHLLKLLREELELCMAQAGCATLSDIRNADIFTAPNRQA